MDLFKKFLFMKAFKSAEGCSSKDEKSYDKKE